MRSVSLFPYRWLSAFSCAYLLLAGHVPVSAEDLTAQQRVDFFLKGIRAERQRLETGEFRVTGQVTDRNEQLGDFRGEIKLFCAFDFPNGKLRFDREDPIRLIAEGTGKEETVIGGGQYVRTREHVIILKRGQDVIHLLPLHRDAMLQWAKPFDVRVLGMAFHYGVPRDTVFDTVWENYSKMTVGDAEEQQDGRWKITWILGGGKAEMLLDTQRGYWPLELSVRSRNPAAGDDAWMEPRITSKLSLIKRSGIWAPNALSWRSHGYSEDLTFEWESVNGPLDEKLFTVDGLDVSSAKRVVDLTLGKAVVVRDFEAEAREKEILAQMGSSRTRFWMVMVSAGVLVLLVGVPFFAAEAASHESVSFFVWLFPLPTR